MLAGLVGGEGCEKGEALPNLSRFASAVLSLEGGESETGRTGGARWTGSADCAGTLPDTLLIVLVELVSSSTSG